MAKAFHVALRIGVTTDYLREIITGVVDFSRAADWLYVEQPWQRRLTGTPLPDDCEGVIVSWQNYEDIAQAVERGIAAVCVTGARASEPVPRVVPDDVGIGRVAGEYLLNKGFRDLAYLPNPNVHWSTLRQKGFSETLEKAGASLHLPGESQRSGENLGRWLASLPKPLAVLAGNDVIAAGCLDACRDADLGVPSDVAVLGVDNTPLICEFSNPALSSVDPRPRRIGYEAAALLDSLLEGQPPPPEDVRVKPGGTVERASTNILAVADPTLAEAICRVRTEALQGLSLKEILGDIAMSRSSLERGFKEILGRTPGSELRRVRLEHARMLLRETSMPISRVADRCGFSSLRHLSDAFQKTYGEPPTDYRQDHH